MRTLIAAMIALVSACADMAPVCPSSEGDGGVSRYVGLAGSMTFDEAVGACAAIGGELARIDGAESLLAISDACRDAHDADSACWIDSSFDSNGISYAWAISTNGPYLAPTRRSNGPIVPLPTYSVVCSLESL